VRNVDSHEFRVVADATLHETGSRSSRGTPGPAPPASTVPRRSLDQVVYVDEVARVPAAVDDRDTIGAKGVHHPTVNDANGP